MIITKAYARQLARAGKATIENCTTSDAQGRLYRIVTRHDVVRVDHYRLTDAEANRRTTAE